MLLSLPALPVLLLLAVLAGCDGTPAARPATPPTSPVSSPAGPVLTVRSVCYGRCAFIPPADLPTTALYADGRLLRADRRGTGWRLTVARLGSADLARALAAAGAAGLDRGTRRRLPLDPGFGVDTGTDTVVVASLGGRPSRVEAPQLGVPAAERHAVDPAARTRLLGLTRLLSTLAARGPAPYHPAGFFLYAVRLAAPLEQPVQPWPGPALAGLPERDPVEGSTWCAVLTGAVASQAATGLDPRGFPRQVRSGQAVWLVSGRPTLPGETSCAAALRTARGGLRRRGQPALTAAERARPVPVSRRPRSAAGPPGPG